MVVHDFHVARDIVVPNKTDSPLIIDSNTVLPATIASQFFQAIGRWNSQVIDYLSCVDHSEFAPSALLDS